MQQLIRVLKKRNCCRCSSHRLLHSRGTAPRNSRFGSVPLQRSHWRPFWTSGISGMESGTKDEGTRGTRHPNGSQFKIKARLSGGQSSNRMWKMWHYSKILKTQRLRKGRNKLNNVNGRQQLGETLTTRTLNPL